MILIDSLRAHMEEMAFTFTSEIAPNFTSAHNKKLCPAFHPVLYFICRKKQHKYARAKATCKMLVKLNPER